MDREGKIVARTESFQVFVSYDEAQQLLKVFKVLKKVGPWKESRESAMRLEEELKMVRRDIGYEPFGGKQIFLSPTDYNFLMDVMAAEGIR